MAFANAVFDGIAKLDGLTARRVTSAEELRRVLAAGEIPVAVWPVVELLQTSNWWAVVDARMRKRVVPKDQRGIAPLTIGLGPNFVAGQTVDLAIETSWGDRLGAVIEAGSTLPLAGEPQPLGGVARARFAYAPVAGRLETTARIGDAVEQGTIIATIAGTIVRAPISGVIRGLTRSGVDVPVRTKVLEVDPRGNPESAFGLGTRPRRIAEGVLKALSQTTVALSA
jgi:xanthine dehydrogenase accessory factor